MRYVDAGTERDDRTWSAPDIEASLEALGYGFIGVLDAHGAPSLRPLVEGDMADADLAWFEERGPFKDLVFWHPELRTFAEVSGWLDDEPTLALRTDFDDGAIVRTRSRYARMPRWRSKTEHVDVYLRSGHAPRAGAWSRVGEGSVEEQHRDHHTWCAAVAARRRTEARRMGTMAAFIDGQSRAVHFAALCNVYGIVQRWVLAAAGALAGIIALPMMLLLGEPGRSVALGVGLLAASGVAVIVNRPHWVPRLLTPRMGGIGEGATLLGDS